MMATEFLSDAATPPNQAERDAQLSRGFVDVSSDRATNLGSYYRRAVLGDEHLPTPESLELAIRQCIEEKARAKQEDRDALVMLRLLTDSDFRARMIADLREKRLLSPEKAALLAADNQGNKP